MTSPHCISIDATLLDALRSLNALSGGAMTLFATDSEGKVCGTLTDGDIRRALLAGSSVDSCVTEAVNRSFCSVRRNHIDPAELRRFRTKGIRLVPVTDDDGTLVDLIDLGRQSTVLPISAILMAGGKGERLRPMTLSTPKPLLEIEGKAIIDYNIEALAACGIRDIFVTVNYLAEQLEEHFSHPVAGVDVCCVRESEPLGTIGAAKLTGLHRRPGDTLVMNSDLLTTISFEELYLAHRDGAADVTIAVIPYQVSVPYAIVTTRTDDPSSVAAIEEKPSYSYYANAGIYVISNDLLAQIPDGVRFDATDLVQLALDSGKRVIYHTIKGTWIDVGSPLDFRQAGELMRHHNSMNAANHRPSASVV